MSIDEFMKRAVARGLSEGDAVLEAQRRFKLSVIKRAGGLRGLRDAFHAAEQKKVAA